MPSRCHKSCFQNKLCGSYLTEITLANLCKECCLMKCLISCFCFVVYQAVAESYCTVATKRKQGTTHDTALSMFVFHLHHLNAVHLRRSCAKPCSRSHCGFSNGLTFSLIQEFTLGQSRQSHHIASKLFYVAGISTCTLCPLSLSNLVQAVCSCTR